MGGSAAPTAALKPGDPVSLPLPKGATELRVERPDGSVVALAPGTEGAPAVTFTQTDLLGVYQATPVFEDAARPSGAASPTATPRATPTDEPSGSPGAGGPAARGNDLTAPVRFAVDLFDVNESAIAPGKAAELEELGRGASGPGGSPVPGASGAPAPASAASRPPARDELWLPIVLLVLLLLCAEWTLYHRDVVLRGWRSFSGRLRRPAGGSA
jgi:hypothetical protein